MLDLFHDRVFRRLVLSLATAGLVGLVAVSALDRDARRASIGRVSTDVAEAGAVLDRAVDDNVVHPDRSFGAAAADPAVATMQACDAVRRLERAAFVKHLDGRLPRTRDVLATAAPPAADTAAAQDEIDALTAALADRYAAADRQLAAWRSTNTALFAAAMMLAAILVADVAGSRRH